MSLHNAGGLNFTISNSNTALLLLGAEIGAVYGKARAHNKGSAKTEMTAHYYR